MGFGYNYNYSYYALQVVPGTTPSDSISGDFTIKIYPLWYKQITLEWSIPTAWGNCSFNIYKSDSRVGNFLQVNLTPLIGTNFFKDTTTLQYSKYNEDWYIIEAVLSNGKRIQSNATTWANNRSSWVQIRAREIQRREYFLLSRYTGVKSFILRRKTYGQRCLECWNFDLEKVMSDKCKACLGTSFEGGFWPAVESYIQYDPSPNDLSYTYFGKFEQNEVMAWTISIPEVIARDLIYRPSDGALYYIKNWKDTELQTVTVRQMFQLVQLDKQSIEYHALITNDLIPQAYQT